MADRSPSHDVALPARVVRIYGTNDQFGENPRTNPLGEPISIADFPREEDRALVWLGEVPPEIARVEKKRAAIGIALLQHLVSDERDRPLSDLVREVEAEQHDIRPELQFTQCSWYLTLAIDRRTSLRREALTDSEPFWLDHGLGVDAAIELVRQLDDVFEVMASTIALRIGGAVLEQRVVGDHVHFFRDDGSALSLPEFSGTASSSVGRPIESLQLDNLAADLQGVGALGLSGLKWFARAAHWHAAAQETRDTWREFEFAVFALEVLTNKIEPRLRKEARRALAFQSEPGSAEIKGTAVASLLWTPERQPLLAKFATVALCLSPDSAEEDIKRFAEIVKRRGELAHGQIKNAGELPSSAATGLSAKYLALGLHRFL
jgi:hypothetical protein